VEPSDRLSYQGRCAVTSCDAGAALEGAHLRPYRGPESNDVTNGLLLRADIHTLFDLRLLAPDPAPGTSSSRSCSPELCTRLFRPSGSLSLQRPGSARVRRF
jgi:hypothetical protein